MWLRVERGNGGCGAFLEQGTGYVTCGACGGKSLAPIPVSVDVNGGKQPLATEDRCATCSGTGKVACIACLCTGKKVARESDPRLDPFA